MVVAMQVMIGGRISAQWHGKVTRLALYIAFYIQPPTVPYELNLVYNTSDLSI